MHRENDMKFEIPKLDRLQRPLSMKSRRGLKSLERLANGLEIKTKVFSVGREFSSKSRARMTSVEILCALFEITSDKVGTRLDRYLQTSEGFVSEKTHPIIQGIVKVGSTIDAAACEDHIRDDSLNEALIIFINCITYL